MVVSRSTQAQAGQSKKASPPALALASDPGKALHLAENFGPDVDLVTAEGLICFGVKGSGKSNLLARLVEQFARFHLPQIILDTKGEYASLINYLPRGIIATAHRMPSGYDVLNRGLQVVVDLRSWATDEAAALAMVQLLSELFSAAQGQAEQDCVPCPIHLDEASYWLPQEMVDYLSKETRLALATTFHTIATRGRSLGLTPFLYTQSISEVKKSAIRQAGIKVLMRQTLDIDLRRYTEYIKGAPGQVKRAVQGFPSGKAVVILPDGAQLVAQFYPRESTHTSHTPRSQAALAKFASVALDLESVPLRDMTNVQPVEQASEEQPRRRAKAEKPATTRPKHAPNYRDRVFMLLSRDPLLDTVQLAAMLGCPKNTAQIAKRDYFIQHPDQVPVRRMSRTEQRIRELLAEDPTYTPSQIAHRTRNSLNAVRKIMARMQESQEARQNG